MYHLSSSKSLKENVESQIIEEKINSLEKNRQDLWKMVSVHASMHLRS